MLILLQLAAPPQDPDIVAGNITDKQARSKKELNYIAKENYAILEEFCQGFYQIFKYAFDSRYHKQLREEVFGYKRITPRQFIKHLKKKWVKLDTMVIKHLQNKFFRRYDINAEHVASFRIQLNRE